MAAVLVEYGNVVKEVEIGENFKDVVRELFNIDQRADIKIKIFKPRWNRFIDISSMEELHDGATVRIHDMERHSLAR